MSRYLTNSLGWHCFTLFNQELEGGESVFLITFESTWSGAVFWLFVVPKAK